MNGIMYNKFLYALGSVTALICLVLLYFSLKWSSAHADYKTEFDNSYMDVANSESIAIYPIAENRDSKAKALAAHKSDIEMLSKSYETYRVGDLKSIQPQAFTDQLKQNTQEIVKAFDLNKSTLPEDFFMGFEVYRSQLAQTNATGIMLFQLEGIKRVFNALASAKAAEVVKIYREPLPEESGKIFQSTPNMVARFLPFEISLRISESSLRKLITSLGSLDSQYVIIRTIAIKNSNTSPPKITDASFESQSEIQAADDKSNLADTQIAFDDLNLQDTKNDSLDGIEAQESQKDTSKILAQVLGNEELDVLIRADLTLFLPTIKLPTP